MFWPRGCSEVLAALMVTLMICQYHLLVRDQEQLSGNSELWERLEVQVWVLEGGEIVFVVFSNQNTIFCYLKSHLKLLLYISK